MVIEESVTVRAPLEKIWEVFVSFACWADWNRVLTDIRSPHDCLTGGQEFGCCMRPYLFPVYFSPKVTHVEPKRRIVWTASKYGISSEHEFFFNETSEGVVISSREVFSGFPLVFGAGLVIRRKVTQLTVSFLEGLRRAAER